jgi:hypothetical protein
MNVRLFPQTPRTYGNEEILTKFPANTVKPVLNDVGKRLAGLIPY